MTVALKRCLCLVPAVTIWISAVPARAEKWGSWTDGDPGKTLASEHLLGAATSLGNGKVIAGGEHDPLEGPDVELHSAALYDARGNKFVDVGPMPFVHDDHAESLLRMNASGNPEVLLFGGNSTTGTSRFEFDASAVPKP